MADRYLDSATGNDADDGSTRALADATLTAALAAQSAGDRLFIENGHAEVLGVTTTYTFLGTLAAPVQLLCVDFPGTADPTPPVSADLRTGAAWTNGTGLGITLGGFAYLRGLQFTPSGTAGTGSLGLATLGVAGMLTFEFCDLGLTNTGASSRVLIGSGGVSIDDVLVRLIDTTLRFGSTSQSIILRGALLVWRGGSVAGTIPTTLFLTAVDTYGTARVIGVDLSALGSGKNLVNVGIAAPQLYDFVACKLGASVAITTGTFTGPGGVQVRLWNCDSGDTNIRSEQHDWAATAITVTDVVRTGGAAHEGVKYARKVTTRASVSSVVPWVASGPMVLVGYFASTGAKTVTVHCLHGQAAALTNTEVWLRLEALTTSGFPLATHPHDGPADILAAATTQTADTGQAWDTGATARANSTAYSLGDIRRAATPNGRMFIVTTAGTSAGSEPAAFATAADGDAVTDNTVIWRQMWRQSLDVAVTIAEIGPFRALVEIGKPSIDVWFDPVVGGAEQQPTTWDVPEGSALSLVATGGGGSLLTHPSMHGGMRG